MKKLKKKVFVGMSGGVDSSVSAALLKEQGYGVVGVFIKVWQPFDSAHGKPFSEKFASSCTWREDRRDAMRVAAQLEISLITLDLEKEYKQSVVDYLVDEYKLGRTPNPDVMCNREIKFGAFYKWAMEHGADFVATGHYARCKNGALKVSKDRAKDQTYFLWTLTPEILTHTLFPIGGYEKSEVRKLAKKFKLPTAKKKDSQGLCFMGKINFKDFLKEFIKEVPGDVINEGGEKIGTHDGAMFYTLGERHGFTITTKTPDDKPYYITAKNVEKNTLTVSHEIKGHRMSSNLGEINLININWTGEAPEANKKLQAQIRYHGKLYPCTVSQGDTLTVTFLNEIPLVAQGQSCVLYDNGICLGGGVIA